jgi:hypothetical protein
VEHYLCSTFQISEGMKSCVFFLLLVSAVCFGQKNSSTVYRPYEINEKNLAKVLSLANDTLFQYSFLIKERELKNELANYFKSATGLSEKIKDIEVITHNNSYFLKSTYSNQSVILTLLHLTEIPNIETYFLILGSNNCISPSGHESCFPTINSSNNEKYNKSCTCFSTKKN